MLKNRIKHWLLKIKFHRFVFPFSFLPTTFRKFVLFSKWINENEELALNDFYNPNPVYNDRWEVFQFVIKNEIANTAIDYYEFGVEDAATFKWWIEKIEEKNSHFYGFDTFEGLPDNWGIYKKGSFSMQGIVPEIADSRGKLIKGLFQETVFDFLKNTSHEKRKVILLDADLYDSTYFVLNTIAPYLKKNDLLIFDEFNSVNHEFSAYLDFSEKNPHIKTSPFAAGGNYACVAFKII